MAGLKYTPPLKLTREQLAEFLPDHQMIRAFENLFATVEPLAPTTIDDLTILAGQADNKVIQALQSLVEIAQTAAINAGSAEDRATQALQAIAQLAQDAALCCAIAEAKGTQALDAISTLTQAVELLALAPPPREFKRSRYGSFLDTTTQTATVVNTAKAITFNTTDIARGVYIDSVVTSRIYVDTEGVYDFQTSLQLDSTVATDEHFYLWIAVNGIDVPNSASTVRLKGNDAELILALNFFLSLKANDYVEFYYSVTDLGVRIQYVGAVAPVPAIPSIILTVSNNIEGVQ